MYNYMDTRSGHYFHLSVSSGLCNDIVVEQWLLTRDASIQQGLPLTITTPNYSQISFLLTPIAQYYPIRAWMKFKYKSMLLC
jgi:hypothetical protein